MRHLLVALSVLLGAASPAAAQVSIGIGVAIPGVQIGVNVPAYPELVVVPGSPVYYDPYARSNYFFYDGLYWVYQGDAWYASSWYDGPWRMVPPGRVPVHVLRVPVRYYRYPPPYFRGWGPEAPPRWGEHWGRGWEREHRGWDRWDHRAVPRPAPLPAYQRQYAGDRYPHAWEQQQALRSEHYRYRPHEPVAREHFAPRGPGGPHAEPGQRFQRDVPGGPRGEPPGQRFQPGGHGDPRGPRGEPPGQRFQRDPGGPHGEGPGPRFQPHDAPGGPPAAGPQRPGPESGRGGPRERGGDEGPRGDRGHERR